MPEATLNRPGVGIMVGVAPFTISSGYAVYRGPVPAGAAHSHAAFQIVMATSGEVTMLDAAGVPHRAPALLVRPMTRHQLPAAADVRTFFIEPQSALADRLRATAAPISGISVLQDLCAEDIHRLGSRVSPVLDPRLVAAMALSDRPIPEVAARVGLSPQRLRALARAELGLPLARWRIWSRLHRATEALRDGRPLAEAAVTAGFADQSHLTRWMREMMGLTPSEVLPALRDQSR